jgi:hypothetical protein
MEAWLIFIIYVTIQINKTSDIFYPISISFIFKPFGSSTWLTDLATKHINLWVMTSTVSYHCPLSNNRCHIKI